MHEVVQDQTGLDCLSEADFVREQPANGFSCASARRHVQLMREQPNTPAEKRADAADANRTEAIDVAQDIGVANSDDVLGIESRIPDPGSRLLLPHKGVAVRRKTQRRAGSIELDHNRATFDGRHPADAQFRVEAMCQEVAWCPGMCRISHRVPAKTSALSASFT